MNREDEPGTAPTRWQGARLQIADKSRDVVFFLGLVSLGLALFGALLIIPIIIVLAAPVILLGLFGFVCAGSAVASAMSAMKREKS